MNGMTRQAMVRSVGLSALCAGVIVGGGGLVLATGASAQDPPGNNGTVKVDDQPIDSIPNNNPHVGCVFHVDFYGFDEDAGDAEVIFTMKAPTKDVGLSVVTGDLTPDIGGTPAGGGNDLDASETYTLSFDGDPHPQQGFHVKLTIHADFSKGADVKHKVFWVEGCEAPPTTPPTTPPTETPPTDTPPTDTPPTDTPPTDTPPTDTPPTDTPPTDTPPTDTPPTDTPPSDTPPTETAPPPAPPTEVVAGVGAGGSDDGSGPGSWWPVGLIGSGALVAGGAALALRRRGEHRA